jgi:hypothetical protein
MHDNIHRPETKVESEVKIYATNQFNENQCIGLNGEFSETILYQPLVSSME